MTGIFQYSRHALVAVLLAASPALAQKSPDLNASILTDPAVKTGTLSNGLRYYVRQNKKPDNKIELRLAVKAGSMQETDEQRGLAHFMEHMNFNGTKNFEKNELVSYLQSIGVEFGADLNAYTSFDQTVYILPIPTDKPGNLDKGFQIIEDWAHSAQLTDKDINDERGVVLEESRLGKGADDRMLQKYFPTYASGTKYAERLPIGKDEVLKNFKPDVIRAYYRDWYRPNLQAVMVVGDIDTATAMKYIRKHFGGLRNPASAPARTYETVTARTEPVAMVVTDKEASNSALQIMFPPKKEKEQKTLADYRASLVRQLALQMINQRLSDVAQSAAAPFPYAQVYVDDMLQGYESFAAYTLFGGEGPEKGLNALTAEMARARQFGFTQSELDRARAEMTASLEKSYNERNTTESKTYIEEYLRAFLDDEPIPGISKEYEYVKTMLPGITVSEVSALPKEWMASNATFTLVTAPDSKDQKLPNDKDLQRMTEAGLAQKVEAMQETQAASALLSKMPARGAIRETKVDKELGATTYTLSNGIMVTVKSTTFKSDEIILTGVKRGGTGAYGVADKSNVRMATQVIGAMGAGEFTPTELDKALAGKTAKVSTSIGEFSNTVSGSSTVKDAETMMQLLYLQLTQPRKDEALFKAYKQKQMMMLQFMASNPQAYFFDTTIKVMYAGNPLAPTVIPKAADYETINLDRAVEIYGKEVGVGDGYHFFITGNVKEDSMKRLIEQYIGALPTTKAIPYIKDNGVRVINGEKDIQVRKGTEKQSFIFRQWHGDAKFSEDLRLRTMAVAEILNIRVIEELREKLGAIYGGGFRADVQQFPYPEFSVIMYLPCGPENVDTLVKSSDREIQNLIANGPSAKDLDKVRSQWREAYKTSVKENKWWNDKLQNVLFWGYDKTHVLGYEKWIDTLTPAQVQETAKTLFGTGNEFTSLLYPEKS